MIRLEFPGEPKSVQSFRFTRQGRKYQPKDVTEWKGYIRCMAQEQLPPEFAPLDCGVNIHVIFVFTPPKSMKKADKDKIEAGLTVYKTTRPDLTDNLFKGVIDALTGICWTNDSRICKERAVKVYGREPRITIEFREV